MWWDYLKATLLIILIIAAAYYVTKFVASKTTGPRGGGEIRIRSAVSLGKDRQLVIAEIGGKAYLLGVTPQHGNVIAKMKIRATGDVTIYGGVQDAVIEAGGDVTIVNGLQGRGTGLVTAQGTLTVKFIEQGRAQAQVAVKADEVVYSEVNCGGDVYLTGKHGSVLGGVIRAGHMTINLSAPLIINMRNREGRQIFLNDKCYTTRMRVADLIAEAAVI